MNLLQISLRNLRLRLLSTSLTTLSIVLGTALIAMIWLVMAATDKHYKSGMLAYNAIVGPKEGAPLSLVLNTVFHFGEAPGVLPLSVYRELHEGSLARKVGVRCAIPQVRGDSFKSFPIIGTTDDMFLKFRLSKDLGRLKLSAGRPFRFGHEDLLAFAEEKAKELAAAEDGEDHEHQHEDGHNHDHSHDHAQVPSAWREAVVGAKVAQDTGMGLGSVFAPTHGKADAPGAHVHEEAATKVVGVLAATGTPLDRAIFIPVAGFLSMDKHDVIRPGQEAEADNVSLSAIIVDTLDHLGGRKLRYAFQTRSDAQVAWPQIELTRLFQLLGAGKRMLEVVAYLVLVVGGLSIMVALYNTMNERRREIAIMRSLGARRWQILRIILQEALVVSFLGSVLGVGLCHAAAFLLIDLVAAVTTVNLDWRAFSPEELYLILGATVLGAVSGIVPAIKGSLTPVAENLGLTS